MTFINDSKASIFSSQLKQPFNSETENIKKCIKYPYAPHTRISQNTDIMHITITQT